MRATLVLFLILVAVTYLSETVSMLARWRPSPSASRLPSILTCFPRAASPSPDRQADKHCCLIPSTHTSRFLVRLFLGRFVPWVEVVDRLSSPAAIPAAAAGVATRRSIAVLEYWVAAQVWAGPADPARTSAGRSPKEKAMWLRGRFFASYPHPKDEAALFKPKAIGMPSRVL